jgi:Fic family protein
MPQNAIYGTQASLGFDFAKAVNYHYDAFPPKNLNYEQLLPSLTAATAALAKYDALLQTLHSSEQLLAPLRRREAVISSRIEGTVATLDEVLKYEAGEGEDDQSYRREVLEVYSYTRAMSAAQRMIGEGLPLSGRLLKNAHQGMMFFGRGADKQPGTFKQDQNFIVDKERKKVLFVPVSADLLANYMHKLEEYMNADGVVPLVKTAITHVEFEALHPFRDGNGRLGRMLITLMLWEQGLISAPHFYVSGCIEQHRDEYIDRLRAVSSDGEWTEWCDFFFRIIETQAVENCNIANAIRDLYEDMKGTFRQITASQWSIIALDFIFSKPIFRNSVFTAQSSIPKQTAHRITSALYENGLLTVAEAASGRRSALYVFEPLMNLTRV